VAVIFARIRGRCSMLAWVVMALLTAWSARSAASLRSLGAVVRLKIMSRSAVG